jgi:hypothetical protein
LNSADSSFNALAQGRIVPSERGLEW